MPLVLVFIITFALVYLLQKKRGAILLDRLHRATLAAMGATFLVLAGAMVVGG